MPWSLVHTAHTNGLTSSLPVSATTIGNLGIFAAGYGTITPPTGGGTWAAIPASAQDDTVNNEFDNWYWTKFTSSVTSITVSLDGSSSCVYGEFAPPAGTIAVDVQDATKAFAAPSGGVYTSNAVTAAGAGELILAAGYDNNGETPTLTAGSGYTLAVAEPGVGTTTACCLEYNLSGAGGSTTATVATNLTGIGTVQIAAFLPGAAVTLPRTPIVVDFAVPRAANY